MASLIAEQRYRLPFLFLFLLLLNLPFLGARDLWAPVEPRYGEIARVMFNHREWILPTVNGAVYTDKPILYFWFVLAASYLAGGVTEWTVRLPSALSAAGVALLTYRLGQNYFNKSVGFLAALVIATTGQVLWEARWAHTDLLFTFFFVASLYFLLPIWLGESNKKDVLLAYGFMGLATLTKGLIGLVLPGLIYLLLLIRTRQWSKLRALDLPRGLGVFLAVTVPWFLAVGLRTDGLWIKEFIWKHHVQRYLAGEGHEQPVYFYFVNFPLDFLPWTIFLVLAVGTYWPKRKALAQPVHLFLTVWFAAVFCFFSFSNTKRGLYLLPLFPPPALLVARYLWDLECRAVPGVRTARAVGYLVCALLVLAGVATPLAAQEFSPASMSAFLPLAMVLAGAGILISRCIRAGRFFSASIWVASAVAVSFLCAQLSIIPIINQYKSPRLLAAEIRKHVGPPDKLYLYADTMNDFNFYLEREVIPVLSKPEQVAHLAKAEFPVYLLLRDRKLLGAAVESPSSWDIVARGRAGEKQWFLLRSKS